MKLVAGGQSCHQVIDEKLFVHERSPSLDSLGFSYCTKTNYVLAMFSGSVLSEGLILVFY